jgi:hypothetical protein
VTRQVKHASQECQNPAGLSSLNVVYGPCAAAKAFLSCVEPQPARLVYLIAPSTSQTQSTIKQATGQRASVAYLSDWSATSFHLL